MSKLGESNLNTSSSFLHCCEVPIFVETNSILYKLKSLSNDFLWKKPEQTFFYRPRVSNIITSMHPLVVNHLKLNILIYKTDCQRRKHIFYIYLLISRSAIKKIELFRSIKLVRITQLFLNRVNFMTTKIVFGKNFSNSQEPVTKQIHHEGIYLDRIIH